MQVVVFSGLAGPFLGDGVRISVIWEGVRAEVPLPYGTMSKLIWFEDLIEIPSWCLLGKAFW